MHNGLKMLSVFSVSSFFLVGLSCPFRLCSLFSLLFLFSFSVSSRSLSFRSLLSVAVYAVSSVSLSLSLFCSSIAS